MLYTTTAFTKIAELKKPIRLVRGGTRAGKTYAILQYLILLAYNNKLTITVVGLTSNMLERGAYEDFKKVLKSMNYYDENNDNLTKKTYTLNNSKIQFITGEEPMKLRGIASDIVYFSEANLLSFETFNEANTRCNLFSICDWNPSNIFWADNYLVGREDVDFITLTYKDNEQLSQKIVDEIESWETLGKTNKFYANRWRVMGLGELGIQEGQVITDYEIIDELPENAKLLGSGLDFGFAGDVSSLISVYRYNDDLIVDEKLYENNLMNHQLAAKIKSTDAVYEMIYADAASPLNIAELRHYGISKIIKVEKGAGSIEYGLGLIQQQHFKITKSSTNLIKELANYVWAKTKDGQELNIPTGADHAIDALRYFFRMKMSKKTNYSNIRWKR